MKKIILEIAMAIEFTKTLERITTNKHLFGTDSVCKCCIMWATMGRHEFGGVHKFTLSFSLIKMICRYGVLETHDI